MSSLEKLQNEVERQKRKITEIENSIEIVENEFNTKFDEERKDIKEQKDFIEDPDLQIAIVGTIKAGKSTFINALFRENIASTDVTPETASLTKFRYSEKNKLEVKFYNKADWDELWKSIGKSSEESGKKNKASVFKDEFEKSGAKLEESKYIGAPVETVEVSDEDFKEKIKYYTSKQSKIHYFVKELTVYLNNKNMPKEVTIVDTPGLNDVVEYRSKITKDYIKRANAVVVCANSSNLGDREYNDTIEVFENVGDRLYKVIILGTQIDKLNNPKEDWRNISDEWKKKYFKSIYREENLIESNIIGVSSYVFSNLIELEKTGKCSNLNKIADLAESYGIKVRYEENDNIIIDRKLIINNSDSIKDLTNIEKVNSLIDKDIISKGVEIAIDDLERKYSSMITHISNKAKTIYDSNSQGRASLDMDKKQQEEFKLMKNKEIEEIETAMNGLNEAFDKIKEEWLNQNSRLKEAIKK